MSLDYDSYGGDHRISLIHLGDPEFGAIFDGITNNDAALAKAANAVNATSAGGILFIPPEGVCAYANPLPWTPGLRLQGAGPGSILKYTGNSNAISFGSQALDVDDPWTEIGIRDLRLIGTAAGAGGIKVRGATRYGIERVRVDGFSNGYGVLLNGASFIGHILGGRIKGCAQGIQALKQAGDGADARGQAFNAIEISGALEIQNCTIGIQIGDPVNQETLPIVGQGAEIHGITIEGNSDAGIWNVDAYMVEVHGCYMEANTNSDVRLGSRTGNTITPLLFNAHGNFINSSAATAAFDLIRGDNPRIRDNVLRGASGAPIPYKVSAAGEFFVSFAQITGNRETAMGAIADNGNYTIYETHQQNGGASPFRQQTGGGWFTRGVLAGPCVQIAGPVTDAAITGAGWPTPMNGMFAVDTTNLRIYVRIAGAWKSVVVA